MNIQLLTEKLGTDNLQQYIVDEYTKGKEEAESKLEGSFSKLNEELDKVETEEAKILRILSTIIRLKKTIDSSYNSELHILKAKAKEFTSNNSLDISTPKEELQNFAKYYLAFLEFQNTPYWLVLHKLQKLRNNSLTFHLQNGLTTELKYYFETLNSICKIDSFIWNLTTFDDGLIKVLLKFSLDKIEYTNNYKFEIEKLKSDIKNFEEEITRLKGEIEFRTDFHNKYYYDSQTNIKNTYFGDNQPFLLNLYNFLKSNNVLSGGWSYFYSCMEIGNNEMLFLNTTKNMKFIGRVFYHLRDFLILHFKDDSEKFIRSKFYINSEPLSPHFFKNHVYVKVDKELNPFIEEIDVFFDKQKKIYLKM